MVNNNTPKKNNISTGVKKESEIYLKKSELPKNVGSFKNDVGYISQSTLDSWLREHNYIPKSEISTLISNANLIVVDSINSQYDEEAIGRLNTYIIEIKGEIVAIKDRLNELDGIESGFISIDKENTFATKSQMQTIENQVTNISTEVSNLNSEVSNLATKEEIPDISGLATKEEIPSLDGYATQQWVQGKGYLTRHQSLDEYAKKTEIPDITNLATKEEIPDISVLATQQWVQEKGYLTSHQSLDNYAKKTDIPSLDGYAKKNSVYDKNYIDTNILSKVYASNIYLNKTDAADIYITKNDAERKYLNIEDYRGLIDATIISDTYKQDTLSDFRRRVNTLRSGFYIVNYNDVVIVKEHEIINVFKDGAPEPVLRWREEEEE